MALITVAATPPNCKETRMYSYVERQNRLPYMVTPKAIIADFAGFPMILFRFIINSIILFSMWQFRKTGKGIPPRSLLRMRRSEFGC